MLNSPRNPVTELLDALHRGAPDAQQRLWQAVYHELYQMAQVQMAREPAGRTLQPTALMNEAYIKLFGGLDARFENRRHFFAAAARAMRQIRVDYARRRGSMKRGGANAQKSETSAAGVAAFDEDPAEVMAVDEVLEKLEIHDAELAEVVHLRYFAGLSVDQTAELLAISPRTVDNRWKCARAWLHKALVGQC